MNILLISQCNKRALTETRRILDQFAERRGERTWQTPITQAGLDTLRRMLRKTARKNTAVACHWIRGRDHSELLWIVGDASRFNEQGAVPTNTTRRDVLRRKDENDWHSLTLIRSLAGLTALLHDLGKACEAFQKRLLHPSKERNLLRHEWITLRMLQSFVGNDTDQQWLQRLMDEPATDRWLVNIQCDFRDASVTRPFATLPPLAQAIGWLILSHHRLPAMPGDEPKYWGGPIKGFRSRQLNNLLDKIGADWNELPHETDTKTIQSYWDFKKQKPLPTTNEHWQKRAARHAKRLLEWSRCSEPPNLLDDPFVMHTARLVLMLADHHFSAQLGDPKPGNGKMLYANTRKIKDSDNEEKRELNQRLDEHLLGVEAQIGPIVHALPGFEHHLPRLARHRKPGEIADALITGLTAEHAAQKRAASFASHSSLLTAEHAAQKRNAELRGRME